MRIAKPTFSQDKASITYNWLVFHFVVAYILDSTMKVSSIVFFTYNAHLQTVKYTITGLIGFAIPVSTAMTNVMIALALIFVLLEKPKQAWSEVMRFHPLALLSLTLCAFIVIGMLYTPSLSEAVNILPKYREFLYIPLFILLFQEQRARHVGLFVFTATMMLILLFTYWIVFTGWQVGKGIPDNPVIFKNHITQGMLVALASYFVLAYTWQQKKWRWLGIVVTLLAIYHTVFMIQGRTGYLVVFCLILLFFYQTLRWRGVLFGLVGASLLAGFAYFVSDKVQQRIDVASQNIESYQQGHTEGSIALRLEFYQNSLALIAQNPLLGSGTGSFGYEYQKIAQRQHLYNTVNPHNEYLMIAVQWGLVGLGLFLMLFYQAWHLSHTLTKMYAWMAQGLLVTIGVGCLVNSLILDTTEGHLFAYLIGMLYGGYVIEKNDSDWQASKLLITFIAGIFITLVAMRMVTLPNLNPLLPFAIKPQVSQHILEKITHYQGQEVQELSFQSHGVTQDNSTSNAQFQTAIQAKALAIGKITLETGSHFKLTTKIQIDKQHVGQEAHVLVIAVYQPPYGQPSILFQPVEGSVYWQTVTDKLHSQHYVSRLPTSLELTFPAQLHADLTGSITIFTGYLLNTDQVIMSATPLALEVVSR